MNSCDRKKKTFFWPERLSMQLRNHHRPADAVTRDVHLEERLRGTLLFAEVVVLVPFIAPGLYQPVPLSWFVPDLVTMRIKPLDWRPFSAL